jgi:Arc/MetJ-type ribon-helix-helix transcriptional regulator
MISWLMSMEEKSKKFTSVSIPKSLFKKIEERIKDKGFSSVSSYITYVLREVLVEEEETEEAFTKEDEERVKARLKALGYLD